MTTGILHIDMGLALGKHDIKYIVEHTGKGYVSFTADMPFLSKIKKDGFIQQITIKPNSNTFNKISKINELLNLYQKLIEFKRYLPLLISDRPTLELNKLKEISADLNLSIFSNFFTAKASVDIDEVQQFLNALTLALQVEKSRSGDFW